MDRPKPHFWGIPCHAIARLSRHHHQCLTSWPTQFSCREQLPSIGGPPGPDLSSITSTAPNAFTTAASPRPYVPLASPRLALPCTYVEFVNTATQPMGTFALPNVAANSSYYPPQFPCVGHFLWQAFRLAKEAIFYFFCVFPCSSLFFPRRSFVVRCILTDLTLMAAAVCLV